LSCSDVTVLGAVLSVSRALPNGKASINVYERNSRLLLLAHPANVAVSPNKNCIGIIAMTPMSIVVGCVTTATQASESSVTISKAS
jgi:hypothetical protein